MLHSDLTSRKMGLKSLSLAYEKYFPKNRLSLLSIFHQHSVEEMSIAMFQTWEKPHVSNLSPAQDSTAKPSSRRNLKLVILLEQVAEENKTSLLS